MPHPGIQSESLVSRCSCGHIRSLIAALAIALLTGDSRAEESPAAITAGSTSDAMTWLGQELNTVAKNRPLLVVWLIDESNSMRDDRMEAAQNLHMLYESLGDRCETMVLSFGADSRQLTAKPVTETVKVCRAFARARFDESGQENMCKGVTFAVQKLAADAKGRKQQMVIITLTDESPSDSGDDMTGPGQLEQTIQLCRQAKVPVYVLGRESTFGKPTARILWKDPVYQLNHWIEINRGPDTASPHRLQWNGLSSAKDSSPAGFGPYSQERLCRETGGGFFILLPRANIENFRQRREALIGYEPELNSRREELAAASVSPFRPTCRKIIGILNPNTDRNLDLRENLYSTEPEEFVQQALKEFGKTAYAWTKLNVAIERLEKIRDLRAAEPSKRWQANYDLLLAQCLAYRVRQIQYILALDAHVAETPETADPKHNRWMIQASRTTIATPTEDEYKRLTLILRLTETRAEFISRLDASRNAAQRAIDDVITSHPGTPWAELAEREKFRDFGLRLNSYLHDPRYQEVGKRIKLPAF